MKRPGVGTASILTGTLAAFLSFSPPMPLPAQTQSPVAANSSPGKSGLALLKIGTNYSIERHDYGDELQAARWGFIDAKGKVLFEPQYDEVRTSRDGITSVRKTGKWGWINRAGAHVDGQLPQQPEFCEGLAAFEREGKWGYIDLTGKVVIEPQWDEAGNFVEDRAV